MAGAGAQGIYRIDDSVDLQMDADRLELDPILERDRQEEAAAAAAAAPPPQQQQGPPPNEINMAGVEAAAAPPPPAAAAAKRGVKRKLEEEEAEAEGAGAGAAAPGVEDEVDMEGEALAGPESKRYKGEKGGGLTIIPDMLEGGRRRRSYRRKLL